MKYSLKFDTNLGIGNLNYITNHGRGHVRSNMNGNTVRFLQCNGGNPVATIISLIKI